MFQIDYRNANVLIYFGATKSFISIKFAHKPRCTIQLLSKALTIRIANQEHISIHLAFPRWEIDMTDHHFLRIT